MKHVLRVLVFLSATLVALADTSSPRAVLDAYIEACRVGDADTLERIFHPDALMSGFYDGEFYSGSPRPFFDEVRDNPSMAETGADYSARAEITDVTDDVAMGTIRESGYFGDDFTNHFHLVRIDGEWQIIAKTYMATQ
jgi:hypothetical protein